MKRFIFSAIAIAAVATACTESGLIDTPDFYANEITFDPYIGKAPVTKAEDIDADYLKVSSKEEPAFHVYAFLHKGEDENKNPIIDIRNPFMDKDVWFVPNAGEEHAGVWRYDGLEYWPNTPLAFVAYNSKAEKSITSHPSHTEFEFTVNDVVEEQVDLLTTTFMKGHVDSDTGNKNVNLVFKHLLSRVGFSVIPTTISSNVDIAIRSIKIFGTFPSVGTVDLTLNREEVISEGETDDQDVKELRPYITPKTGTTVDQYSLFDGNDCFVINSADCKNETTNAIVAKPIYSNSVLHLDKDKWEERYTSLDNADADNRYMMLIPCNPGADTYIEVEYQLTSDIKRTAKVRLDNWVFKPGFAYEFILKVSTDSIDFDAQMGGWTGSEAAAGPLIPLS